MTDYILRVRNSNTILQIETFNDSKLGFTIRIFFFFFFFFFKKNYKEKKKKKKKHEKLAKLVTLSNLLNEKDLQLNEKQLIPKKV